MAAAFCCPAVAAAVPVSYDTAVLLLLVLLLYIYMYVYNIYQVPGVYYQNLLRPMSCITWCVIDERLTNFRDDLFVQEKTAQKQLIFAIYTAVVMSGSVRTVGPLPPWDCSTVLGTKHLGVLRGLSPKTGLLWY